MKKSEMVSAVAEKAQLTRAQAEAAMKAYTDTIIEALKNENKAHISGFGTFEIRERKKRTSPFAKDQEKFASDVEYKHVPVFRAAKNLKDQF